MEYLLAYMSKDCPCYVFLGTLSRRQRDFSQKFFTVELGSSCLAAIGLIRRTFVPMESRCGGLPGVKLGAFGVLSVANSGRATALRPR
jgi:hypothetical protein